MVIIFFVFVCCWLGPFANGGNDYPKMRRGGREKVVIDKEMRNCDDNAQATIDGLFLCASGMNGPSVRLAVQYITEMMMTANGEEGGIWRFLSIENCGFSAVMELSLGLFLFTFNTDLMNIYVCVAIVDLWLLNMHSSGRQATNHAMDGGGEYGCRDEDGERLPACLRYIC